MEKKNYYKRKNYNYHSSKRRKTLVLEPGLKGFFCTTCNGREKECVKESYNILNDYSDKIYPSEKEASTVKEESSDEIEDELEKEIASHNPTTAIGPRKFQVVDTGTKGCIFIKTTLDDPVHLAHEIMTDIDKSKQRKARYLLRLVPIEVTCKAYIDEIRKAADKLFDKHFKCEPTTFSIVFNKRNNNNVLRDEIIESLALIVNDKNTNHKADLKQAKFSVMVEIMRNMCCMSVIPDYFLLRKYNIAELSKTVQLTDTVDDHKRDETHLGGDDVTHIKGEETHLGGDNETHIKGEETHLGGDNETHVKGEEVHLGEGDSCLRDVDKKQEKNVKQE